jgi:Cu(I)/Ag(I) efflux system membrane protein CusA/SilA
MLNKLIRFFLENKLVTVLLLLLFVGWGIAVAPFNWESSWYPRDPVSVDAIPDIGENQQIVYTQWMGRSPQDIEDQITYPLTTTLLGVPGVKTIRSSSMFGFSSIYVIFEEDIEFYWSRSRILEKLNSLPAGTLPEGVQPTLGPDATGLGQIFWYTLEGRDTSGNAVGGWDPQELRSIQDFNVKYALSSASGVSEVASIGGFVQEYQVDLDPVAMRAHNVSLPEVMNAVRNSNIDVGAKTIEVNQVEYMIRGLGYIKSIEDIEESVVVARDNVPIRIKDVAKVALGPAPRRGALDKGGVEAVGGVVVARYGANPLEVISNVKAQIALIAPGLPEKILADGATSKVTVVPFYDRTELIHETLGTLEEALTMEILITIIVIILMVMNLRASIIISALLPVSVLMCFIAMRYVGVDANIVALSGIAIAIGTMVDMGIVLSENILRHFKNADAKESRLEIVYRATTEVASAVLTAVATTIVSFIPIFAMVAAEGKLFKPLAFTKTFALLSAIIVALVILPSFAQWLLGAKSNRNGLRKRMNVGVMIAGSILAAFYLWGGISLFLIGLAGFIERGGIEKLERYGKQISTFVYAGVVAYILTREWQPLGPSSGLFTNFIFVALLIGILIGFFYAIIHLYPRLLRWCLNNKWKFLSIPIVILCWGVLSWIGFAKIFGLDDKTVENSSVLTSISNTFPGTSKEFMPALDEGSFLLMPTSMPHSGMEENRNILAQLDMLTTSIPEVETVVGKLGRTASALDPAPISMFENLISYKSEYKTDKNGNRVRFAVNDDGTFRYDSAGELIADDSGIYYRQWRDHIRSVDDIWDEIAAISLPGVTPAPRLQPIQTRLVMLQTGMRSPIGIKIKGPSLDTIQAFGYKLEKILKRVKGVKEKSVFADRIVGKPYLELKLDRQAMGRYGLTVKQVQHYIEVAIGGMTNTTTIEGRERYGVRVRYARELRDDPEQIKNILIPASDGTQVQLGDIIEIQYTQGPQVIKSENTFLQGYVLFDKLKGFSEVDVVEEAQKTIDELIASKDLRVPAGVSFEFAGNYENQVRAENKLLLVLPLALGLIFLILYFQFKSIATSLMIFSGIAVAFSGGFIMIWLYSKGWFFNFALFGTNMRELFHMETVNLSVAVWVGFIALFGIATDDGVIIATYLKQNFAEKTPETVEDVREAVIEAGSRRIRPCLMTTATTILALLPILTSTGRGSDIMIPMAIPALGGMMIEIITLFVLPVLFSMWKESKLKK